MKNKILPIIALLSCLLIACDGNNWTKFDKDQNYIYFVGEKLSIYENSDKVLAVVVGASGIYDQTLTVGFEVVIEDSTAGYKTAKEGIDFEILNPTRTLSFSKGVGYDTIRIKPIDNDVKDNHRAFRIVLKNNDPSYAVGMNGKGSTAEVVIFDDESSSKWEGNWEVSGKTVWYYSSSNQLKATADTASNITQAFATYTVTIVAHPTEVGVLLVRNFMGQEQLQLSLLVNDEDELSIQAGVIGQIDGFDIYFGGFDADGEDTGINPVQIEVVDSNTLRVIRFMSYYESSSGEIMYTGPSATVLKSTWKRLD